MSISISNFLKLVKFSHTIFALPFAFVGFAIALKTTDYSFSWLLLIQIIGCMVFARNAAMGFNRYVDRKIDALNPRTALREIPSGVLSPKSVIGFIIINIILFSLTAYSINILCLYLSFPALVVLLGYSYTKRFTAFCHYFLGMALAIAPIGAYIAITGYVSVPILLLSLIVFLWSSGFDIIYSLSDEEFDKENKMHSIPQLLGKRNALIISLIGHLLVLPILIILYKSLNFGLLYIIGASLFSLLLLYQHIIVKPNDLSRVNAAFFTANGFASVIFGVLTILDLLLNF